MSNKRLTNDIVDERLIGREIRRMENYVNNSTKMRWGCSVEECDNEWRTSYGSVQRGHGCPKCSQGKSERLTRKIFERILGKKFPSVRPDFLKNQRTNHNLELDGCNKDYDLHLNIKENSTMNILLFSIKPRKRFALSKNATG